MNGLSNPSTPSSSSPDSQGSEPDPSTDDGEPSSSRPTPSPEIADERDSGEPTGEVQLAWHCDTDDAIDHWLRDKYLQVTQILGVPAGAVTLAIVEDAEMVDLHEQYKNVPGTTDVLTFDLRVQDNDDDDDSQDAPASSNVEPADAEGDVVLCLDEAKRQATARGHETSHELLLYAIHGLLHLVGYDDHDEADAAAMHAREDELLIQIGLGPIYQSGA